MRRLFFPVAALLLFGAVAATAQVTKTTETKVSTDTTTGGRTITRDTIISSSEDITPRDNMITINPLKFILFYNLNYYHRFSSISVFGGGIQMPTISGIDGFGFNLEYRFYPSKHALRGFYVAPNFSFNSLTVTNTFDNSNPTATSTSIGVLLGWQWFIGEDFAIGLGIGIDYYFFSGHDSNYDYSSSLSGLNGTAPALRFDIGYAW